MQYANECIFVPGYSRMYSRGMSISSRLDEAMREARFKSQKDLERASGVPQATISRILKGAGKNGPETETLRKLAVTCEVNFEWLLQGAGPKRRGDPPDDGPALAKPHVDREAVANDIFQLVKAYRYADARGRKLLMDSAKLALKGIAVDVEKSAND
jgi:transcriptional regulator with XRE-family HTH domain